MAQCIIFFLFSKFVLCFPPLYNLTFFGTGEVSQANSKNALKLRHTEIF